VSYFNQTIRKFDLANTLIKEYDNWYLMLRRKQVTLGSIVLLCKDDVDQFSHISKESFSEFSDIVTDIEEKLKENFNFDKINYLMLMMVDPAVHFHIVPRYSSNKDFGGIIFKDYGWDTKLPALDTVNEITDNVFQDLRSHLTSLFK
jgi:diadenosine tetraphosphate (Ap4A) HIT family hydrolase